jgi:BirA family biotin operon repressor/biotin-[acetyl-CoA-carboxylase] ligase
VSSGATKGAGGSAEQGRTEATVGAIAQAWPRELTAVSLLAASRLDSTQRFARACVDRLLEEAEEPPTFVVVALEQSAGRGRQGRTWASAAGKGLWASLVLELDARSAQSLPMRVAVALATAVNGLLGEARCRLKWPNDLVIGHDKVGGLLVDAVTRPDGRVWSVVGFGINHGHGPDELPALGAVSLRLAAGTRRVPALAELLARAQTELWSELSGDDSDWLERYRSLAAHRAGDRISCDLPDGRLEGTFAGFDECGFLVVATERGPRTVRSGEVFSW